MAFIFGLMAAHPWLLQVVAQTKKKATPKASGFLAYGMWILILVMVVVFYFLLIRPQRKRAQEHDEMVTKAPQMSQVQTPSYRGVSTKEHIPGSSSSELNTQKNGNHKGLLDVHVASTEETKEKPPSFGATGLNVLGVLFCLVGIVVLVAASLIIGAVIFIVGILLLVAAQIIQSSKKKEWYQAKSLELQQQQQTYTQHKSQMNQQTPTAEVATKKCPFCAEDIKAEAIKCKHCGSDLASPSTE